MKNDRDKEIQNLIEAKEEADLTKENTEAKMEVDIDNRNLKEKLYDKIPISLKTLDIIITILITIFVLMMLYFIIQKFS